MMNDEYKAVSCELHSQYELAIMRKQMLRIAWLDSKKEPHISCVLPEDIFTRNHAEYLLVTNEKGELIELRLDKITYTSPLTE